MSGTFMWQLEQARQLWHKFDEKFQGALFSASDPELCYWFKLFARAIKEGNEHEQTLALQLDGWYTKFTYDKS